MSMAIGDILKVTDNQGYLGQLVQNVFFYKVTAIPVTAGGMDEYEQVCASFNADVRILELAIQHEQLEHGVTTVDNITNGLDFGAVEADVFGLLEGDELASFYALNFILRRTSKITRNGSKRFAGVAETSVNGNSYTGSMTPVNALAAALAAPLKDGASPTPNDFAIPVIVGRKLVSGHYEYDLTKINPVSSAAFTAVSTQRSRKAGHGG